MAEAAARQHAALTGGRAPPRALPLRDPARPASARGRYTVYYDGACDLCVTSVNGIRRLGWLDPIVFVDVSDRAAFERLEPELDWQAAMRAMHVRAPDGSVHAGYHGFRALLKTMPLLWPLRPLLALPGVTAIGERVYAWVARTRYRWNPCEGACELHRP